MPSSFTSEEILALKEIAAAHLKCPQCHGLKEVRERYNFKDWGYKICPLCEGTGKRHLEATKEKDA